MISNFIKVAINWSDYDMLLIEDRRMIDEYIGKMKPDEINSFMKRLINYYKIEEVLQVDEDKDSVIVFEHNKTLSKDNNDILKLKTARAIKYIYLYIESFKTSNNLSIKCLGMAINKFLETKGIDIIEWYKMRPTQKKYAQNEIRAIYLTMAKDKDDVIGKINNIKLPICFYTYRNEKSIGLYKKRIGIALDKIVLPGSLNVLAGYGRNFKIDNKFIKIELIDKNKKIDISAFIKNVGYWAPKNANLHGFDDRTGIIWFDGTRVDDNSWRLPNGIIIKDNSGAVINAVYVSDAFAKMVQRINNKLRKILSKKNI